MHAGTLPTRAAACQQLQLQRQRRLLEMVRVVRRKRKQTTSETERCYGCYGQTRGPTGTCDTIRSDLDL